MPVGVNLVVASREMYKEEYVNIHHFIGPLKPKPRLLSGQHLSASYTRNGKSIGWIIENSLLEKEEPSITISKSDIFVNPSVKNNTALFHWTDW